MKRPAVVAVLGVLALGGCTGVSGALEGQIEDGSEHFTGTVTDSPFGEGKLTLTTSTGATCTGSFVHPQDDPHASGILTCSDGRSGTFHIVVGSFTDNSGSGDLGGKPITMTIK